MQNRVLRTLAVGAGAVGRRGRAARSHSNTDKCERAHGRSAVSVPGPVSPKPGEVLKIHEDNYRCGIGELVLKVTQVRSAQQLPDGEWVTIVGVQLAWDGSDLEERELLVRLSIKEATSLKGIQAPRSPQRSSSVVRESYPPVGLEQISPRPLRAHLQSCIAQVHQTSSERNR